jgi:GTP pyrophosphokinase
VATLVDGVTKLEMIDQFSQTAEERRGTQETESLRKMFIAMAEDVRVVIIKLADRLHNMRTLDGLSPQRRVEFARETMDIFAPLANRLGVWQWKWQLEDLSLKYLDPAAYQEIVNYLQTGRGFREESIQRDVDLLRDRLRDAGIQAEVSGRPKSIYSIYTKMGRKNVQFQQVYDVRALRVLVETIPDCYRALGIVHAIWYPIPGEFDDYIATPKDNMYRSLHTAVRNRDPEEQAAVDEAHGIDRPRQENSDARDLQTREVQIRTHEMHRVAEYGVAAHWRYKEGSKRDEAFEAKIAWLRSLMDWRQDVTDASEFVDAMKTDVFEDRVYVFTPKGQLIDLPMGATPIDFAYHIHTEIGHRCRGARVNDVWTKLDHRLRTGDQVRIITGKRASPSRDWLNPTLGYVRTSRARAKIRQWFRRQDRDKNIAMGRDMVERELKRLGMERIGLESLARLFEFDSVDDFHAAVGFGDIHTTQVAGKIAETAATREEPEEAPVVPPPSGETTVDGIQVQGTGGLLTRLARCCNPLPGDDIVGYVTRGHGVTIHRRDCPNALRATGTGRLIEVDWGTTPQTVPATIGIRAYDRTGLLHDISGILSAEKMSITGSAVDVDRATNISTIYITVEISDITQLSRTLRKTEQLANVIEARRYTR